MTAVQGGAAQAPIVRVRRTLITLIEAALAVMIFLLLVLILTQVVTRYALEISAPWTEEAARALLIWTVMLGAVVAMDRREHYVIGSVIALFRPAVRKHVAIVTNLLGILFLAVMTWYGFIFSWTNQHSIYVTLGLSRTWVFAALPTGAALMALILLLQTIRLSVLPADRIDEEFAASSGEHKAQEV